MTASGFRNQVKNKNFLNPTGFKFILNRAPNSSILFQLSKYSRIKFRNC